LQSVQTERRRDYFGLATNTDIWSNFAFRPDDIIVDTPPKCGTTWMLNIVMMLIHGHVVPDAGNRKAAPWLDCGFRDREAIAAFLDGLERRRCIKSHTPMDGIQYGIEPTYIVVYRHPVDAHFSLRTHAANMKDDFLDHLTSQDEREGFHRYVNSPAIGAGSDNHSLASFIHHFKAARRRQGRGNVHFFHYADMTRDLRGQIARLADILNISVSPHLLDELTEANSFASMREAAKASDTRFGNDASFHDMASFFASGTSNKWEGRLTDSDLAAYTARVETLLDAEDVAWINWGDRRTP
jgi:aryl sulfotransferase